MPAQRRFRPGTTNRKSWNFCPSCHRRKSKDGFPLTPQQRRTFILWKLVFTLTATNIGFTSPRQIRNFRCSEWNCFGSCWKNKIRKRRSSKSKKSCNACWCHWLFCFMRSDARRGHRYDCLCCRVALGCFSGFYRNDRHHGPFGRFSKFNCKIDGLG